MIECEAFADVCRERGYDFFTGVPDSTFKSWMSYLGRDDTGLTNVTTVNEGEATAVATGYHLATGDVAVCYMQNDGLGKAVNPLTSLTNDEVYEIPILLMIGWRSEPGIDDAVQHDKMGEILQDLLELLDVPYSVLPESIDEVDPVFDEAAEHFEREGTPYAVIVRKGTFEPDTTENVGGPGTTSREAAVEATVDALDGDELVLSTTGKLSRELYEYRKRAGHDLGDDFYNVGAMGSVQSIGLGVALGRPDRDVVVLDGDGSVLMQLGALATTGHQAPDRFHHFVFDNAAHDSTGGQPTSSTTVDFGAVAEACGYEHSRTVSTPAEIQAAVEDDLSRTGPTLTVVEIERGARDDLGRPTESLAELKRLFVENARASPPGTDGGEDAARADGGDP